MMKAIYLGISLLVAVILLSGCGNTNTEQIRNADPTEEVSMDYPEKEELISLLSEAKKIDRELYSEKSNTEEEIFSLYEPYYTRDYVSRIVLGGGNLKKNGDKWEAANSGGELLEGTFINQIDEEKLKIDKNNKVITLTNVVQDGLYPPHDEVITLINTESGWKIDDLKWLKN